MSTLFRDVISLDWDDIAALLVGVAALIAVFRVKRSHRLVREDKVDADVLSKFEALWRKISELESVVAEQGFELRAALTEIREMKKVEEYLQGKVHEREKQIKSLTLDLAAARKRIRHLELVCKRAGINGDD